MSLILVNDGAFDPRALQSQETPLACPACNAHTITNGVTFAQAVEASQPREVWTHGARMQDRKCRACGHQWATVLPPAHVANHSAPNGTVSLFKL